MGLRQTGKYGKIYLPVGDGTVTNNTELTMTAAKTIGGTLYTNRFFGKASTYWNRNKALTVRIQGIVGSVDIQPTGANNEVSVTGFSYYKDNGTIQTAAADSSVVVTRPAGNVAKWNLIILTLSTGAISAVAGTDASDTTFLNTFGTSAGQIPVCTSDQIILGAVKLTTSADAAITASQIVYVDGNGVLLQERSDIPTYDVLPMEGGILLTEALLANHTGGTTRKIYATFYDQYNLMQPLSHTTGWTLSESLNSVDFPAQNDVGTPSDISGAPIFTGTLGRYAVDSVLFKAACQRKTGFLKLYRNINNPTEYYECACIFTSFSESNNNDAAATSEVGFKVDGILEWRGVE